MFFGSKQQGKGEPFMQKYGRTTGLEKRRALMAVLLAVLFFCSPLSLAPSSAEAKKRFRYAESGRQPVSAD